MGSNLINTKVSLYRSIIDKAIARVLGRGVFLNGPEVQIIEQLFSHYLKVPFCITVGNGTDALEIALRAAGIKEGNKVATVSNAGFYSSTAMLALKANPFYLDVDYETKVVTKNEVKRALQNGIKAVIVTHLYGKTVPEIEEIAKLCQKQQVILIEDCAQAHGALIHNKKVGSFGDIGCFSFYPTKNLGALGDGGAIVCKNEKLAATIEKLRQYGWRSKYCVEISGARNSRMDEIQAAILNDFLPYLDDWNQQRRDIATQYSKLIMHPWVAVPPSPAEDDVVHLYVVRCKNREALRSHLEKKMIATDIHYPIPDHRQPVFADQFNHVMLPNTEQLSEEILTLPCYPGMKEEEVQEVIQGVNTWGNNS